MTLFGVEEVQALLDHPVSCLTPTRLLLINYWLYPVQSFHFVRGRLFLTGHNGSGKSTALTAAVTLLLDGDSSPTRLDAFGGTLRQLRYYLLGGPDAGFQEEARRSYLALEFRTPEGGYETVGLGLHASAGSSTIGKWGFWLPGRVQPGSLELVEQGQPLSERTLKERVRALQGEIASGQGEYAALVRRRLYSAPERDFQEMIDLLLTVRGSKLGRDVRPSKITEVLRRSLPAIAGQVTQKLAEGIERLDRHAQRLSMLEVQEQAARGVAQANFALVLGRARQAQGRLQAAGKQDVQARRELHEAQVDRDRLTTALTGWREQARATARELEGARVELESTEVQVGGQEQALTSTERRLSEVRTLLEQNRRRARTAHERSLKVQARLGQNQDDRLVKVGQIESLQAALGQLAWWEPGDAPAGLDRRAQALDQAQAALRAFERDAGRLKEQQRMATTAAEQAETARQGLAEVTDGQERILRDTAAFLHDRAATLHFPTELLSAYRDGLEVGAELSEAFEVLASEAESLTLKAQDLQATARDRLRDLTGEQQHLHSQYAALEKQPGAVPPLPRGREEALSALEAHGIPARPFYRLVRPRAEGAGLGTIEGALLATGLLTALVVSREDQAAALSALTEAGLADALLIPGSPAAESLDGLLEPEDGVPVTVSAILSSIPVTFMSPGAPVAITRQGWRHGLLTGGNPDEGVRFLGAVAREQERQKQLSALQDRLSEINASLNTAQEDFTSARRGADHLAAVLQELQGSPVVTRERRQAERAREDARQRLLLRTEAQEAALHAWQEAQAAAEAARHRLQDAFGPLGLQETAGEDALRAAQQEHRLARETLSALGQVQAEVSRLNEAIATQQEEQQDLQREQLDYDSERQALEAQRDALATQLATLRAQHDAPDTAKLRQQAQGLRALVRDLERRDRDLVRQTTEAEERLRGVTVRLPPLEAAAQAAGVHLTQATERLAEIRLEHPALAGDTAPDLSPTVTDEDLQQLQHQLWVTFDQARPLLETPESYHPTRTLAGPRFHIQGVTATADQLFMHLTAELESARRLLTDEEARVFHDELIRELVEELDRKQRLAAGWVERLRATLRGLAFHSEQLDVTARVQPPADEPAARLAALIDTRIDPTHQPAPWWQAVREEVRALIQILQARAGADVSFAQALERALDYREWTQFTFFSVTLDRRREITDRTFAQRSGGERSAMLYTFLFAALAARFDQCGPRTPRLLGLDEAFAGMDLANIGVLYRIMDSLNLAWIATSQNRIDLSADLSGAATYQLLRVSTPHGDSVGTLAYIWDGTRIHDSGRSGLT